MDSKASSRLDDFSVSDAARADPHALRRLPDKNTNALQIGIPPPVRQVMRVTDPMTVHRTFAANLTSVP